MYIVFYPYSSFFKLVHSATNLGYGLHFWFHAELIFTEFTFLGVWAFDPSLEATLMNILQRPSTQTWRDQRLVGFCLTVTYSANLCWWNHWGHWDAFLWGSFWFVVTVFRNWCCYLSLWWLWFQILQRQNTNGEMKIKQISLPFRQATSKITTCTVYM